MKNIAKLADKIKSELKDAKDDYTTASHLICEIETKELALVYKKIGLQELEHVMMWHGAVVKEIDKYKAMGHTVPPEMQARYDVLHDLMIEEYSKTKADLEKIN